MGLTVEPWQTETYTCVDPGTPLNARLALECSCLTRSDTVKNGTDASPVENEKVDEEQRQALLQHGKLNETTC